jgi:hypothetical protein
VASTAVLSRRALVPLVQRRPGSGRRVGEAEDRAPDRQGPVEARPNSGLVTRCGTRRSWTAPPTASRTSKVDAAGGPSRGTHASGRPDTTRLTGATAHQM